MIEPFRCSIGRALLRRVRAFAHDRRGVAAIEFAILVPLLFCLYFVSMEVSQGVETSKKNGRISSMVADLITQQTSISSSEVDAIMKIGEALLQPYNRSKPTITVTAIRISDDTTPKVTVAWSRRMTNGAMSTPFTVGEKTTVPAKLLLRDSFLIKVDSTMGYKPVLLWSAADKKALGIMSSFDAIAMGETYYLRPRQTEIIACSGC